jgi:hypothetical protein
MQGLSFHRLAGASTVDRVIGLLLLLTAAVVVAVGWRLSTRLGLVLGSLTDLREHIRANRAAHDHQVDVVDRRMRAVEAAAASAERESRIVALQVVDLDGAIANQTQVLVAVRDRLGLHPSRADIHPAVRAPVTRLPGRRGHR